MADAAAGPVPVVPVVPVYLVHYGAPEWCASAAAAVLGSEGVEVRLTVVDNGPPEADLAAHLPAGARVLSAPANLGFAGAANLGLDDWRAAAVATPYCVVGSHDLHPEPAALARLVAAAGRHPSYGVLAAAVVGPTVAGGGTWDGWRPRRLPPDREPAAEVVARDWVPATCVLLRRECIDAAGGFDARLGSYLDDVDLSLRAAGAGFGVGYVPGARVRGLGSASPDVAFWVGRNTVLVAAKHGGPARLAQAAARLAGSAVRAGAAAWLVPGRAAGQREQSRAFWRLHVKALAAVARSHRLIRTLLAEHRREGRGAAPHYTSAAGGRLSD